MSFMLLGILNAQAGGASFPYRLQLFGTTGSESGKAALLDSSGNLIISSSNGGTIRSYLVLKLDATGAKVYGKAVGSTASITNYGADIDGSDNVYQNGTQFGGGVLGTTWNMFATKFNSSGNLQWQRNLGEGATNDQGTKVAVSSAGNGYYVGSVGSPAIVLKLNSSGTTQWGRVWGGSVSTYYGVGIDSSENVYACGASNTGYSSLTAHVVKYNSSGTVQWQRRYGDGTSQTLFDGVKVDSNGDVYAVGGTYLSSAGSQDGMIVKYNSSGTLQWARRIGSTQSDKYVDVAFDSDNNVYAVGEHRDPSGATKTRALIVKYNSSGTIQWQRILGTADYSIRAKGIVVDESNNLYITGEADGVGTGGDDAFILFVPNDGSLTGTYTIASVDCFYSASGLDNGSLSLTDAAGSQSTGNDNASNGVTSYSTLTPTLTEYRTDF